MNKSIKIKDLLKKFIVLKQVAGGQNSIEREITHGQILQPGFEMNGFMFPENLNYIFLFQLREKKYVNHAMNAKSFKKIFSEFISYKPLCFIFDWNFPCPKLIKQLGDEHNVAILQVNNDEFSISYHLQNFLSETFAPSKEEYATCLSIFGCGVLIEGHPGVGKSEAALELIKKSHLFVSDDRVILKRVGNNILAFSPNITKDYIEVRGIGIVNVKKMFGVQISTNRVKIDLIIKLAEWNELENFDRLGIDLSYKNILNIKIPFYSLPIKPGRSVSSLIETIVIRFLLQKEGFNATKELNKKLSMLNNK